MSKTAPRARHKTNTPSDPDDETRTLTRWRTTLYRGFDGYGHTKVRTPELTELNPAKQAMGKELELIPASL